MINPFNNSRLKKDNSQISIPNELMEQLINDFTTINISINSTTYTSLKHTISLCKVLNEEQVRNVYNRLNMIKVRNKNYSVLKQKIRKTKSQIRQQIIEELEKAKTLSVYELNKLTNLSYATINNFITNDQKNETTYQLLKVANSGKAKYIMLRKGNE